MISWRDCRPRLLGLIHLARIAGIAALVAAAMVGQARAQDSEYIVGPGDVLKISVYRAPDLDSLARIAADGTIPVGALGNVEVADLSPSAVAQRIAARLKSAGIYVDPVVNVTVAEYHSRTVSVFGAVARPGEYPIDRRDLSITEVLARAGANSPTGATLVSIVPAGGGPVETISIGELIAANKDRPIRRGESLFVQTAAMVYVRGEVQRPGAFPIEPGLTIDQAIALAGGLTPRGSSSGVRVTHRDAQNQPMAPVRGALADKVQPNDTIVVRARLF